VYDFGLASVLDQQQPFAREDCGSLGYTAPELLRKEPYGVEVDMFSTGVILFVVLSGYRPFNLPGADRNVIKQRIINCEYTMDPVRWRRVSPEAQKLVRSLMVEREYRLKASDAVQHEWFREDEATLANHNLRENATYIETGANLEPRWAMDHSGESVRNLCLRLLIPLQQKKSQ
jgi:calcium/calmodulin-dependent protein kinase I